MDPLKPLLAAALLLVARPAAATVADWQPLIAEASLRFDIPEGWIARVMRAESGGRTMVAGRPIRSPKGAIGLMQLMPGTWTDMRVRLALGSDPDDPRDNILAGTFYLRLMYDRFGYPGLFGAYNAGPARYAAWLSGRGRLPGETIAYVAQVAGKPARAAGAAAPAKSPSLFAVRRDAVPTAPGPTEIPTSLGLFAVRRAPE